MKTIIAVTFIGCLTYAFAEEPPKKQTCSYRAMANFDSTKYLEMTTAPLYSTYANDSIITVCNVIKNIQESGDKVITYKEKYYEFSGQRYFYELSCSTEKKNFEKGQYKAECNMLKGTYSEVNETYEIYMAVVDTDYESYAILYTCYSGQSGIAANFEVLQKNPDDCVDQVDGSLSKIGMTLNDFKPRNATYCQNMNKDEKQET